MALGTCCRTTQRQSTPCGRRTCRMHAATSLPLVQPQPQRGKPGRTAAAGNGLATGRTASRFRGFRRRSNPASAPARAAARRRSSSRARRGTERQRTARPQAWSAAAHHRRPPCRRAAPACLCGDGHAFSSSSPLWSSSRLPRPPGPSAPSAPLSVRAPAPSPSAAAAAAATAAHWRHPSHFPPPLRPPSIRRHPTPHPPFASSQRARSSGGVHTGRSPRALPFKISDEGTHLHERKGDGRWQGGQWRLAGKRVPREQMPHK